MALRRYVLAILGLAALVTAAPAPTKTASPNCITGEPAVPYPYPDGSFPVTAYATVTPLPSHGSAIDKPTHYQLLPAWRIAHDIFGGQDDRLSNTTIGGPADAYTAMKCQYKCNQYDRCVAYFVTNDGGPCIFLDAIINPALFVYDQYAEPFGGYNLLCNPPPNPFNGPSTTLESRQDRGYKPDGTSPTPVNIAGRQDRGYKLDGSALTAVVAGGQDRRMVKGDETHVAPMQSWVNYAPNADFTTKHGHYVFNNIETGDGAGFETTHRACHSICTGLTWCKSIFISYIKSQWTCTIFNFDLTPDVYVQDNVTKVNTWPYGFNQKC
ncbi:hypothetical protein GE09DRAFT_1053245 [Coniochaeta sp. 2T2.1]|nr:hypothetical protein GE09DRAFT_1053245 [Coniochaeta sp. 2T2.1]